MTFYLGNKITNVYPR